MPPTATGSSQLAEEDNDFKSSYTDVPPPHKSVAEEDELFNPIDVKDDNDNSSSITLLPTKAKGRGRGRLVNDQEASVHGDENFIKHQIGKYIGSDHRGSHEHVGSQHSQVADQKELLKAMKGVKQDQRPGPSVPRILPRIDVRNEGEGRRYARLNAIF